jgi:hypothetical protein
MGALLACSFGRFAPYGDVLFGYGRADYPADYIYNTYQYVRSSDFVYSPGGGLCYRLNNRLSLKADAQFQHWNVPVTNSGSAWARSLSLGVAYHFHGELPHWQKLDKNDPGWHKVSEDQRGTKR